MARCCDVPTISTSDEGVRVTEATIVLSRRKVALCALGVMALAGAAAGIAGMVVPLPVLAWVGGCAWGAGVTALIASGRSEGSGDDGSS